MCSLAEDIVEETVSRKNVVTKCVKCNELAVTVARGKDPFCQACFCTYFRQKFRTTLGKLRVIRPGEKVLLACSGGPSSTVLLRLLTDVLKDHSARKVPTTLAVLFIDEGGVAGVSLADRCSSTFHVLSEPASLGLACFVVPIETIFWDSTQLPLSDCNDKGISSERVMASIATPGDTTSRLTASLNNFVSLSAKQSFVHIARQRVLVEVTRRLQYTKVFLGDNASKVSADLIANIAQGRGATVPLDTGFVDDHYQSVSIVRPLREFQQREVQDFATFNNIASVKSPQYDSHHISTKGSTSSIEQVTVAFVEDLQSKFPSTINTIFRTGEKLGVPDSSSGDVCHLCLAPIFKPREDIVFPYVSSECASSNIKLEHLCYGCCLIVRDMKSPDTKFLPVHD